MTGAYAITLEYFLQCLGYIANTLISFCFIVLVAYFLFVCFFCVIFFTDSALNIDLQHYNIREF
jgi:flagellar biosynthesis protein FlhB